MEPLRRRFSVACEHVLRLPPIWAVDYILRNYWNLGDDQIPDNNFQTFNDPGFTYFDLLSNYTSVTLSWSSNAVDIFENVHSSFTTFVEYCIRFHAILLILFVFRLKKNALVTFYTFLLSFFVIYASYFVNVKLLDLIVLGQPTLLQIVCTTTCVTAIQVLLSYAFDVLNADLKVFYVIFFLFVMPNLSYLLPFVPQIVLEIMTLVSPALASLCFGVCVMYKIKIWSAVIHEIKYVQYILNLFGFVELISREWQRVNVITVIRIFWFTHMLEQALVIYFDLNLDADGLIQLTYSDWSEIFINLLNKGCDTIVTVYGLASVLSAICQKIVDLFRNFLLIEHQEDVPNIGFISTLLFMILAFQTGLTTLSPEKRFPRLYRNLFLLIAAVLHYLHGIVNPLLMNFSTRLDVSFRLQLRVLSVCIFLILLPCTIIIYLWSTHSISTWLLAVTTFSVELIVKVVTSVLIYALFAIDARRSTSWDLLDDYVYYIKCTSNTIEFIFGIFLLFNGAWILIFEAGGVIRCIMIFIHSYFNIFLQAKAGWKTFIKRRTAVTKIASIPEATIEQLQEYDDVCTICYQELSSGTKRTKCNHIFHGACLRKWLYLKDNCPLCQQELFETAKSK